MKMIKNYKKIAVTKLRKQALEMIEAGIKKVHPGSLIKAGVRYNRNFNSLTAQNKTYDIIRGRIFVVGGGKAAGLMAQALEKIIGADNITAGIVNCHSDDYKLEKIEIIQAGHPLPDRKGVKGVDKMLDLKDEYEISEKDLVICLISGGGSSLMPGPVEAISLKDKQAVTQLLLESGADIREINAVRKHLSRVKGGRLGRHFQPAQVVSLILSDVVDNNLNVIASGPTVPDPTTFKDAQAVLVKYNLLEEILPKVKKYIGRGCDGQEEESPKELDNCDNYIIGDINMALEVMALKAKTLGLKPIIVSATLAGTPEIVGQRISQEIASGEYRDYNTLIFGGETTPGLPKAHGQGGRNQHLAAVSALAMQDYKKEWVMASVGTDGSDYLPEVAGAMVDNNTLAIARQKGLEVEDYINNYETFNLFKKIGSSLIVTGDTGTNVGDVMVYILK
jgi:hydroxypyruvate reductase/glycerate 2-kinase